MLSFLILLRAVLRLLACGLLLLAGVLIVALLFPWFRPPLRAWIKRRWSRLLLGALGVRIVADADMAIPAGLVVANHISFLDIFVIDALAPTVFVAKSEVRDWPLIGWLTAHTGNLFLARGRRQAAQQMRERIVAELTAARRVAIFPEGTTTTGATILPFHAALLQSAIDGGVPLVCLALAYRTAEGDATAAPAYVDDDSLWDCLWRIACSDGLVARVALAGILAVSNAERRQLARLAQARVIDALARIDRNLGVTGKQSACHLGAEECETSDEPERRAI